MNIGAVIEYLNKTYGYDLNSSYYTYIAEWRDWWTGFHRPFHEFVEMRQNKPIHRELFTLHMGKKVCEALQEAKYVAGNRMVLDSLDHMFYEAREKGDREEMERIREVSSPYYESASEQTRKLINGEIAKNKGSYFGLYLYYTYRFQNHTFNTVEEIDEARNFIGSFDEASRRSGIYVKMQEGLDKFARCATGSVAPAITGIDLKGNSVSLNDFKGKYVLVDFWFAGCSWCRKETPYLLKTYNAFKDKKE